MVFVENSLGQFSIIWDNREACNQGIYMQDFATITALVLGLTEVAKTAGLPSKYAPLLAVVLGVICSGIFSSFSKEGIFTGIIAALSAMGLYAGTKRLGTE